ncbi:hypothetical protein PTTG_06339 [Puccinia triticina 1-1 BBBD Race 1]|uniref:Uncharacterized protein n=1 Tax=Puccinia triticina (isolate 1-1 / race 1 (BBBD)) TaxID=630390 RepID=A0A0C4EZS8_PUCT1|nr:hypothetical protein PTTG_06339 [Puccinia triticina 1-1 BBBD Race 1]
MYPPASLAPDVVPQDVSPEENSDADEDPSSWTSTCSIDPRFATVPEAIRFYLAENVDLNARPSTKPNLVKMIRHFFPEYHPRPLNCLKAVVIRDFEEKISPLIAEYLKHNSSAEQTDNKETDDVEMRNVAPPKIPDLSGINPHSPTITVSSLLDIIKRNFPKFNYPRGIKKPSAIGFFHKYIMPPPKGGYPAPFTVFAKPVPKPYHKYLTRDELRFAMQCHCPHIYIPIDTSKKILQALYEQFVLDDLADEEVYEGFHFYVTTNRPVE